MHVEEILRTKGRAVYTVEATQTLAEAIALLNKHNIGAAVVLDAGGDIAGILSERDIVRRMSGDLASLRATPVGDCMTAKPKTCALRDTVDEVMKVMTGGRFRHLPVAENGKLIGLVSIGDVVKRKIELAEEEAARLRDYIAS